MGKQRRDFPSCSFISGVIHIYNSIVTNSDKKKELEDATRQLDRISRSIGRCFSALLVELDALRRSANSKRVSRVGQMVS